MNPPTASMKVLLFVFLGIMCVYTEVSQGSCVCEYGCNSACPGCCISGGNNQCFNPQGCCNHPANANATVTATATQRVQRVQTKHRRKEDYFCPIYGTTPDRQTTPTPEKSTTPEERTTPTPEKRTTPTPEKKTTPTPEKKTTPTPEKRTTPTPEKKTTLTPEKRTTPTPEKKTTRTPGQRTTSPDRESTTPGLNPTNCQPADYAWLFRGHESGANADTDAYYINLSPYGNFGASYEDCNDKNYHGTTTNTFAKVRIAIGNVLGSTFVVVNGTDATYREGAYHANCPFTYPAWGQADSCDNEYGSPVSINLTNTPFSLALGSSSFKTFDEVVANPFIQIQCSSESGSSNANKVCSGYCGGDCGGCSAGPHGFVLLEVTDQRAFDCGILAHSNTNYVCKSSRCVPGPSNYNFSTCESLCQI